jgi:putative ABC transport system substrate-binding protein
MPSTHRRILTAAAALALCVSFPWSALAGQRIGILLWNSQPRYEQCRKGMIEQLHKEGFKEPDVVFLVEEAFGNRTTASEVARKFAAAHLDLVMPVGTSAAVAVAAEIKDVPVVFGMVFDPVEAGIARGWKSSGNNTTGSSSKVSAAKLLATLGQLTPVKRLAVLYTPGERNSETQLHELEALQEGRGLVVVPAGLLSRADTPRVMDRVMASAEAVVLTGSSVVGDTISTIVALAAKARVITVTQSEDHLDKGVLLGVTVNPAAVGRLAGEKAARVLRGARPDSLPIEPLKTVDVVVNLRTAKATGIEVPAALKAAASRLIE